MNLKLSGVQKLINELAKVESEVSAEVDAEIEASLNTMVRNAKDTAPANFSQLRNSIGKAKESKLKYSLFASAWYAPYVEFGTRGQVKVPKELEAIASQIKGRQSRGNFQQFVESIYLWGTKKKIIKKGDKNHALNIARKIYKQGIAPQPYLWPAFVAERSKLVANIRAVVNRKR